MSDIESQPNEILHLYQEIWRAPVAIMPVADLAEQCAEAAQKIAAAQLGYAQAAISMNAKLCTFWLDKTADASPIHVARDEQARDRETA